jgi:hypothetical protein
MGGRRGRRGRPGRRGALVWSQHRRRLGQEVSQEAEHFSSEAHWNQSSLAVPKFFKQELFHERVSEGTDGLFAGAARPRSDAPVQAGQFCPINGLAVLPSAGLSASFRGRPCTGNQLR